jgi:three-Cys-motif partner protein
MTRAPYKFTPGGPLAQIKQHSVVKHEVLRSYLLDYFLTLVAARQDMMRLTLVDGFAGGGIFTHETTGKEVLGSPFVFLQAVEEAQARLNQDRDKKVVLDAHFYFVEKERPTMQLLQNTLRDRGYAGRINREIHLREGEFDTHAQEIIAAADARSPRAGRAVFFLDQYGYNQVPAPLIQSIFARLPKAEVLLTFNVDAFATYANDVIAQRLSDQLGIPDIFRGKSLEQIKASGKDYRLFIQSTLYERLTAACGARFYTPFFIRTTGHGDYWLLHLSQHHRARDVMTRVHWAKNNFIHYGGAGINMFQGLGYEAARDEAFTKQPGLGFCFDESAAEVSVKRLTEQLPKLIHASPDGILFGELFATTCNTSPADSDKYKQALARLAQHKEIQIVSLKGGHRHSASTITDTDRLVVPRQRTLFLGN